MTRIGTITVPVLLLLLPVAAVAERALQATEITVKGMICSSCSDAVEQAVKKLDGVDEVRVDLRKNQVRVKYDPAKVTPPRMVEVIRKGGYEARWPADEPRR